MAGIGNFKPIKLFQIVNSRNANGDNVEVTAAEYKLWAEITSNGQSRTLASGKTNLFDTKTFKIRFREDWILNGDWVIQYYGKLYEISGIERIDEKRFNYLVTATGTYNTFTTPFTVLPNGTPVGGGGGGTGGGGGGGGTTPTNFTAFTYDQETGEITFSGGSGTANTQVSFLAYPYTGFSYVNGFNEGVSGRVTSTNTLTETSLTPGTLNIRWRRTLPSPPYTPLTDNAMMELVVTRLPKKYFGLNQLNAAPIHSYDFPIYPINKDGVQLAQADTVDDYINIMNADSANAACFTILSYIETTTLYFYINPIAPYQDYNGWNRTLRGTII